MSFPVDTYALKSVSDLPTPFRSTFNFRYFNSLQSECFAGCYLSDMNMVISAPTGSGKTVLFELCILRLLSRFLSKEGRFIHIKGTLKTIYIAPSKALVQEKLRDWNQKLGSWGIKCLELTGDSESHSPRNIQEADIILTTPEKFDSVTRYRIRDGGLSFFCDIGLVLIDEVHLLNDPRGASLEAIVSRIKMLARSPEMGSSALAHVRFLAVSATIPNIEDLGKFGEEMRPVKLTTRVFGYAPAKNDFLFERRLQNYVFVITCERHFADILMQHSRGKSALIFCSTRKGAQEAALRLSQTAITFGLSNPFIKSREQQERLKEASLSCSDKQMQSCILFGVGYHNGGLCLKDRNLIEGLFLRGDLQILCTTNTLAHGINLPAHTVASKTYILSSNKEKGFYMEYDRSMILQMCGRAGRPPFDDTGMVIIMTRKETVHLYENLLSGCEMVESHGSYLVACGCDPFVGEPGKVAMPLLLSCVTEHLAAEIVQLTVCDIPRAIEWMKCSYLYNPANYALKKRIPGESLEKHMQEICVKKVNELSSHGMIWTDEYGFLLKPLEPGRLMTKYYLKFDTMKNIMSTPESCSLEDALHIVCRSEEIAWIQLRRNEKKVLNDINSDKEGRLRFHILSENGKRKKRIQSREEKIFVLANDCLTGDPLCHDLSLNQDMNSICSNGCRIAKCMKEYFIYKKNYKGALNSTLLAKCLDQKLWDDSQYLLKQLTGIGTVTAKALNSAGINSFGTLAEADPRRIEIVTGRKYPFGNHIKESLLSLPPKVGMSIEEIECRRQGKSKLVITLTRLSQSVSATKRHCADMVVGSEEDNLILFHERISPYSATVLVSNPQQGKLTVKADLIFEEYIGLDIHETLLMVKAMESNMIHKRGAQKTTSTYDLPKDIYVVEDDEENTTSHIPSEEFHVSNKSKETSSMPSFNLLEEDMDEDVLVIETEEKESETITEQTIFDHIRRKAKNFPVFATSNFVDSSTSEVLMSAKKRQSWNQIESHSAIEVLEETDSNIERENMIIPDVEPQDEQNPSYGFSEDAALRQHIISRSSGSFDLLEEDMNIGVTAPKIEDNILEKVTQETTRKRFCHNQFDRNGSVEVIEGTISKKLSRESSIVPDTEMGEMEKPVYGINGSTSVKHYTISASSRSRSGKAHISSEVSGTIIDPTETEMSFTNLSSSKEDVRLPHSGRDASQLKSSGDYSGKQQHYSNGSTRQLCSSDTKDENSNIVSFLGFKSVFSFL
ncbi:Helicase [Macleaya cordata]|uniref:DNA 3'-5' helicase n=1 Tax=Macleaya cordata TaxID=56857 RepID=A0A200RAX7_MACCD|nr:Helicase [Macleaya cordata]